MAQAIYCSFQPHENVSNGNSRKSSNKRLSITHAERQRRSCVLRFDSKRRGEVAVRRVDQMSGLLTNATSSVVLQLHRQLLKSIAKPTGLRCYDFRGEIVVSIC